MANVLDGLFGGLRRFLKDGTEQPFHSTLNLKGEWTVAEGVDGSGNPTIELTPPPGALATLISTGFTQPAVNANVAVAVVSTAGMAAGMIVFVESGGYYQLVTVVDASNLTLNNLGYVGNAAPGAAVPNGARVTPGGVAGAPGASGPPGANGVVGNAQPSLKIFTLGGVENIQIQSHIHLTDYPYNAKASVATSTFGCTAGSAVVTLGAAGDWTNRDGIFLPRAGALPTLITPVAPTVAVRGTTGATSRTYKIAGMTASFAITAVSPAVTPTNTNATLSDANYVQVNAPVTPMVDGYTRVNVANLAAFVVAQVNRTYIAGETVWLAAQTAAGENGPYVVGTVAAGTAPLTRATWCDSAAEATALSGYFVPVRASRSYGSGFAGTPRMLQVTSGTITTLGTDPITTSEEVETILVYVNDSRTAGNDRLLGGMATRADWYSSTIVPHFHFYDIGQAVSSPDTFIPNTASGSPIAGALIARVLSGGGTTTLTLDRNAVSTVASNTARHDNSLALQEAIDACSASGSDIGKRIFIPDADTSYRFHRAIEVDKQIRLYGNGEDSTKLEWCGGTGWLRVRGGSLSRTGSSAFGARISDLWFTSTNRVLPNGGDYYSSPYDGGSGTTYDAGTQLYTGGFSDVRALSWFHGAGNLTHVQASFESCRSSFCNSTPFVFSGTSDDTGSNCNNAGVRDLIVSSVLAGHGIAVYGYDSSNGRYYNVRVTGAAAGATFWDQSFTGCHWYSPHGEACYIACMFNGSATAGEMFAPYFEGGMIKGRGPKSAMAYGGTFGTNIEGISFIIGGTFSPGTSYTHGTTPNRVYRQFGDPNSGFVEQVQTEASALAIPLRTNWNVIAEELQRYIGTTGYMVDAIAAASTKIWGGVSYARGLLLGTSPNRRALRCEPGVPTTSTHRIYEPGDFLIDSNTSRQIRVRARCVCTTSVWAATTNKFRGDVIVPSSNNTLARGFVCSTGGTTSGAQPNWDAVADNTTVADGSVVWTCWGTTGSGAPQFDLPLEAVAGTPLGDTSPTLQIGGGSRYVRRAAVQTANRTVTLGVTGVDDGDLITIECEAHATYTLAVVDGGTSGATLRTVPAARAEAVCFRYDLATTSWVFSGKVRVS